jgi:hypothetical protein
LSLQEGRYGEGKGEEDAIQAMIFMKKPVIC